MTRQEAARVLGVLQAPYPNVQITADLFEVWFGSALDRCDLSVAMAAAQRIVGEDQWFPTPARFNEVRRAIEAGATPAQAALEAGPRSAMERENAAKFIGMSRDLLAKWKAVRR